MDVGRTLVLLALKGLAGGAFVVAFAIVAVTLTPKRLAGILTAAPAVGLGGLFMTVAFSGGHQAAVATLGMAFGAVGMAAYSVVVVPAFRRLGAWPGATAAVGGWALVAFGLYAAVFA